MRKLRADVPNKEVRMEAQLKARSEASDRRGPEFLRE
jgi:hypothetical protein